MTVTVTVRGRGRGRGRGKGRGRVRVSVRVTSASTGLTMVPRSSMGMGGRQNSSPLAARTKHATERPPPHATKPWPPPWSLRKSFSPLRQPRVRVRVRGRVRVRASTCAAVLLSA